MNTQGVKERVYFILFFKINVVEITSCLYTGRNAVLKKEILMLQERKELIALIMSLRKQNRIGYVIQVEELVSDRMKAINFLC